MDSSQTSSSSFDSFKSKKIPHSILPAKPSPSDQSPKAPIQNPWSSKTPEKPLNPPRRLRNRGAALSLKEVRQLAKKLQTQDPSGGPERTTHQKEQVSNKPDERPVTKSKRSNSSTKLPEKYEILDKFFSSLDSSIRLLRIKGVMSTFTNISPKIECLTDRRFSYNHLAQLKFIFPEAIEMEKVLVRDERTSCMKPDIHITLNVNAIDDDMKLKSHSGNLLLRKFFRERLLDFCKAHPEGDDVPEGTLPEPFNQSKQQSMHVNAIRGSCSLTIEKTVVPEKQPAAASHLSQSFRRGFSKRVSRSEAVSTLQVPPKVAVRTSVLPDSEVNFDQSHSEKEASTSINLSVRSAISTRSLASGDFSGCPPSSCCPATPIKILDSSENEVLSTVSSTFQGTPSKLFSTPAKPICATPVQETPSKSLSTPAKLMSSTPALQPTKRCYMSPDDNSISSPNKLVRHPQRSRSLKFDTPVKNQHAKEANERRGLIHDANESGNLIHDSDIFYLLPENLLQSIREKEKKALEDKDPAISQAKRRQKIIASLPKLFDMIHFFFQSIKRSTITKDELMHKIISNHLDIVDRREVEEQLELLQELVPEWIYEKSASTGDLLLCINKISRPESIRGKLAEAK